MVYLLEDFRDFSKGLASFRGEDGVGRWAGRVFKCLPN